MDATYVNTTDFSVSGDYTTWLTRGTAVELTQTAGNAYSRVQSSTYSGGLTTVTLEAAVVVATLTAIDTGPAVGPDNSFPYHSHPRLEGHGGPLGFNAIQRMEFTYKDADEVYINPGAYYIQNNANDPGLTFWSNAILTFAFSGLGASEMHYVYADYSAIVAENFGEVDETCFFNSDTAPTWDDDRQGWYSTDDLCIWGIPTNSASEIYPFKQVGKEIIYFEFEATHDLIDAGDIDTSWLTYTADIPIFSREAYFFIIWGSITITDIGSLFYQSADLATSENSLLIFVGNDSDYNSIMAWVPVDSSLQFKLKASVSSTLATYFQSGGFKLGRGQ